MVNNRLDKLLDSIECGDPSVQACNYEMPSPVRSEFKKPSYGFFVERERPKVEQGDPRSVSSNELAVLYNQILGVPWSDEETSPPVDKEKAQSVFEEDINTVCKLAKVSKAEESKCKAPVGVYVDELDAVPDPPSLMEKRKTSYHTQAKIMHQRTYAEVAEEMKRIVYLGEFESGEIKFNAPSAGCSRQDLVNSFLSCRGVTEAKVSLVRLGSIKIDLVIDDTCVDFKRIDAMREGIPANVYAELVFHKQGCNHVTT